MRFNQHRPHGISIDLPRETSAELISPDLGAQLRNVATINDRGEMAVVAFFPTGVIAVLLIRCDDRGGENEDCHSSANLNAYSERTSKQRLAGPLLIDTE